MQFKIDAQQLLFKTRPQNPAQLVAGGGGNLVAQGGGNLLASGGGNVISNNGAGRHVIPRDVWVGSL